MAEVYKYCPKNFVMLLPFNASKKYNSNAYDAFTPETIFNVYNQKITFVGIFYHI